MANSMTLPSTQRALVLSSFEEGPQVKSVPTPTVTPGSIIIQVLGTPILPYANKVFFGKMPYPLTLPMTIGSSAIGRVAVVGGDATTLKEGQLVLFEPTIRGRDNPAETILFGLHGGATDGARKMMEGEWRNATYAEYAKVPLENVHVLDEQKLVKELGYSTGDLCYMLRELVPMGGLVALDIKPGEKIIIGPATGSFGGAAVEVAIGMGATVIAAGRSEEALESIAKISNRVKTVQITGNVEEDAKALVQFGEADAYLDFSPSAAAKSTHIMSCLLALKTKGRACFMGGITETVQIPYGLLMFKSLHLMGKFMYERDAVERLIQMVESGLVKLGANAGLKVIGSHSLEEWKKAFDEAEENPGWGVQVLFSPQKSA